MEQRGDAIDLVFAFGDPVHFDRLADDVANGHAGIEAADGVLENDLHLPAQAAQRLALVGEEVLALVADLAGGGGNQAEDRSADGGFAAAGFADEAERFTRLDVEGDAVDGFHMSDRREKSPRRMGNQVLQIAHLQERAGCRDPSRQALV